MTPNPTTPAPTTEEWMIKAAKEIRKLINSDTYVNEPFPTWLNATLGLVIARHYADAHPAGTEKERAKQLAGALAEIKDRVRMDEDFSADEIVEFIDKFIGKFSIGPTWAVSAAAKEEITELQSALAEAKARCAELTEKLTDTMDARNVAWLDFAHMKARAETAEARCAEMEKALYKK